MLYNHNIFICILLFWVAHARIQYNAKQNINDILWKKTLFMFECMFYVILIQWNSLCIKWNFVISHFILIFSFLLSQEKILSSLNDKNCGKSIILQNNYNYHWTVNDSCLKLNIVWWTQTTSKSKKIMYKRSSNQHEDTRTMLF